MYRHGNRTSSLKFAPGICRDSVGRRAGALSVWGFCRGHVESMDIIVSSKKRIQQESVDPHNTGTLSIPRRTGRAANELAFARALLRCRIPSLLTLVNIRPFKIVLFLGIYPQCPLQVPWDGEGGMGLVHITGGYMPLASRLQPVAVLLSFSTHDMMNEFRIERP